MLQGRRHLGPMRQWAWTLATVRGIPVRLHVTFALLVVFLLWHTRAHAQLHSAAIELAIIACVFGCVVLHEIGHAVVAQRYGIPITDITLYPFGGLARMEQRPESWVVELAIAAAGPAVNLGIAVLAWCATLGRALAPGPGMTIRLASVLLWSNLIVAGFNLLPAFPLDGGRILRSVLASRLGWTKATIWAASIGQVAGMMLIGLGFLWDWWLVLAGLLLLPGANSELRWALTIRSLHASTVRDVMVTRLRKVSSSTALGAISRRQQHRLPSEVVITEGERVLGYLPDARLREMQNGSGQESLSAADAMLTVADAVVTDTQIADALLHLRHEEAEAAPVVSRRGKLVGLVTRTTLERTQSLLEHLLQHSEHER